MGRGLPKRPVRVSCIGLAFVDMHSQARKALSVNGYVLPTEKLRHDTLDALALSAAMFVELVGTVPALFKADVDSAFRRIPVKREERWMCGIVFMVDGQVA